MFVDDLLRCTAGRPIESLILGRPVRFGKIASYLFGLVATSCSFTNWSVAGTIAAYLAGLVACSFSLTNWSVAGMSASYLRLLFRARPCSGIMVYASAERVSCKSTAGYSC